MTDCKFKTGETYRTRDGREARVYATDGGGEFPIHGAVRHEDGWNVETWTETGDTYKLREHRNDLMPPKRKVWIAVSTLDGSDVCAFVFDQDPEANSLTPWRIVKVLGPVEIEDTQ